MTDLARRLQAMHDPDQLDEWGDPIPHPVAQDALAEIARLTAALADARGEATLSKMETVRLQADEHVKAGKIIKGGVNQNFANLAAGAATIAQEA